MKKRIILALPMLLVLGWIGYVFLTNWNNLKISTVLIMLCSVLFALHFICIQLSGKFIDFLDGFKIKGITQENFGNFQKGRRILGGIMIIILLVMFVVDFLMR